MDVKHRLDGFYTPFYFSYITEDDLITMDMSSKTKYRTYEGISDTLKKEIDKQNGDAIT